MTAIKSRKVRIKKFNYVNCVYFSILFKYIFLFQSLFREEKQKVVSFKREFYYQKVDIFIHGFTSYHFQANNIQLFLAILSILQKIFEKKKTPNKV